MQETHRAQSHVYETELKLEKVYREGKLQTYSNEKREFYRDSARDNLYGCYFNEKN